MRGAERRRGVVGGGGRRLTAEDEVGGKVDIDITFHFLHNAKYSCPLCERLAAYNEYHRNLIEERVFRIQSFHCLLPGVFTENPDFL